MNFQQLRILREARRRNFNLTDVADALATSQSGVSKHIKDLEAELGVEIFRRHGKRLMGMTEPGEAIVAIADRMLIDAASIRGVADDMRRADSGELTVATTHTQARYVLPPVIAAFRKAYPKVRLALLQASPSEISAMLAEGSADIAVATESLATTPELAAFAYYSWRHLVIAPMGHPLTDGGALTLARLAQWPLITYQPGFTGRPSIDRAFAKARLKPDIAMAALDADVIKEYVTLGLGVGIVAEMAFDPTRDIGLLALPSEGLFGLNTAHVAIRRGRFLRGYAYRFIEACRPELSQPAIVEALRRMEASG